MKCYYPIDSAGNRIGFKTPEACVYDASGTSLTTKLAQINSNISKKIDSSHFNIVGGSIASNDISKCPNACSWSKYGNIMIVWIHSYITVGTAYTHFAVYTLPNDWTTKIHTSAPLINEHNLNTGTCSTLPDESNRSIFIGAGDTAINNVYVDGCLIILLA